MTPSHLKAEVIPKADRVQRWSLASSIFAFVMLGLICVIGIWTLREVDESDFWVDHTFTVISNQQQLMVNLRDAEASTRAYILDPGDRNRAEFQSAAAGIHSRFETSKAMTADNLLQQKRLGALKPLLYARLAEFSGVISTRDQLGAAAAESRIRDVANEDLGQRIRDASRAFQLEEYALLQQRSTLRRTRTGQGLLGTLGAACFALIALVLAPIQVRRAVRQRDFANREKRESDSLVRSLFDAAPQAILIVDRDGSIVMANRETERIFGHSAEQLRHKPIEILLPDELKGTHSCHRDGFFANPQTRPMGHNLDLLARRSDGSEFHAEINLSYIESTRGTLAVAFASDITRRRADEQAIREQREELRQLAGRLMTAQEDERRRIARNLHDDLNQSLACISMDLGKLAVKDAFEQVSPQLRAVQKRAGEAADLVRKISHQLHPAILDDLGIKAALEDLCDEFQQRTGIDTQLSFQNVPGYLSGEVSSCVYYIAGECLRNVSKHARAQSVFVDVEVAGESLCLSVKDTGVGYSRNSPNAHGGIGVSAMKERVRLQGGSLTIQSSPGNGTRVAVEVPIAAS